MGARRPSQLSLELPQRSRRGGKRPGAGRKPKGPRPGVPHTRRLGFASRRPLHCTLRFLHDVGNLRGARQYRAVHRALCEARADGRRDLRVVHYSVQSNHIHIVVEADRTAALSRGMQGLAIRIARGVNRAKGRKGAVFTDRYHSVSLDSPLQVRRAMAYVLNNARRHAAQDDATYPRVWLDPCSSAPYFDGWRDRRSPCPPAAGDPVAPARSWLLRTGWRRRGLIALHEIPGPLTWVAGLDGVG